VVTEDENIHRKLLEVYHDARTVGHARVTRTIRALTKDYWWPNIRHFVQDFVQGCVQCQQNKTNTHPNHPPLQPIPLSADAQPFSTIAIDFVVKLPVLNGYDSILTITDHDCTKAVILLPCKESMDSLGVAKLYLEWVFLFVGLPD